MANPYGLNFIKIGGIWIIGGQKPPIRGVTFDLWCLFSNLDELFESKVMCENLVWIGWNRRYVNLRGGGGRRIPIRRGYKWLAMPIFIHGWAISVKILVWKFGLDCLSLSRVTVSTDKKKKKKKKNLGGRNPLLGGLHLTFDAHFRTQMSYSSQKSCVKIWFGLVEIGGM